MPGQTGVVFNIQKFSVHDGPGIRTIVFLKGCPLRCRWCSNPESHLGGPQLAYNPDRCIGTAACGLCVEVCDRGAITGNGAGKISIERVMCNHCGVCAGVCPSGALEILGKPMSVRDVLRAVEEDDAIYSRSGGGLTLSGGEPLVQPDFARELLREAKKGGLDTAVETCGWADWKALEGIAPYLNTVLYDVKCMDAEKHRTFTGRSNALILENLAKLCRHFPELSVIVRTPVVPGFNDTEADLGAIVDYVQGFPGVKYELLAYHRFGEAKYRYLGMEYPLEGVDRLSGARMKELTDFVEDRTAQNTAD